MSSSCGASVVSQVPSKNWLAGTVRSPSGPVMSSSASSASATAGYSAAGSAWAIEPPIVPRLRIWKCPISGVAAASNGTSRSITSLASSVLCPDDRTEYDMTVHALDKAQRGDAADVDQSIEPRQTEVEHRDQALAAGQHLRLVAEVAEQLDGVLDGRRRVILEWCRLHHIPLTSVFKSEQ